MKQIVLDFESYYDAEYSLRKMTPVEYILDPRFETIGCAVKEGDAPAFWLTHEELIAYIAGLPPKVIVLSHNALFDMCLLAWRYGYVPHLMIDTMGMARAFMGHVLRSVALASVGAYLGLGAKGDTVYKVQGMSLAAIKAAGFYEAYAAYSCNDADLCWKIYRHFVGTGFPASEIAVMDTVLRCAVLPTFVLNRTMLAEHLHGVIQGKAELLARAGLADRTDLMSNDKFAEALRRLGVEPPRKISLTTGNKTYAFAKTDQDFTALEEHADPEVQALVSARMGIKSTIEETRTQRLISISHLTWPGKTDGPATQPALLPIPLRYSGAHTHRLCLVGETWIVVLVEGRAETIRLDRLRPDDLIWDGQSFVNHGGLVYAGKKSVIHYDGITGTPDHRVWTLERGYLPLAEAKARGCDIARGDVPDPARIEKVVLGPDPEQDLDPLHMLAMWSPDAIPPCGPLIPPPCLVPLVSKEGAHEGGVTFAGSARSGGASEREGYLGAPSAVGNTKAPADREAVCAGAGEAAGPPMAGRSLRARQSAMGVEDGSGAQPILVDTWDIVACGPRNRFMANGRIVHNSGDWSLNLQNLPSRNNNRIRMAIEAPPGHTVVVADSSQVEARGAAWFCGQHDLVRQFANKEDVYSSFATDVFGYPVAKATHPVERFTGKTCVLGLQYALGWLRFQTSIAVASKAQLGEALVFSDEEAARIVGVYRKRYHRIPAMWRLLEGMIPRMTARTLHEEVGPCTFMHERIRLPNGLFLRYHQLENREGQWWFTYGGKPGTIYGGKMLENIIQALSRIMTMDAAVRVRRVLDDAGLGNRVHLNLQVHDELVYVTPDDLVGTMKKILYAEMIRRPLWGSDIPLDAEVGTGGAYGSAK